MHYFAVSMILIVLSVVHIHGFEHRSVRQTGSQCPNINLCDYVKCENGQCIENKTSIDCYTCVCPPGYTGQLCETPVATGNGCNPPCLNGGQCEQKTLNTFTCTCPADYTGVQCETSVLSTHQCVTMPSICQNGGTCAINGLGYLCHCPTGWSGTNCETRDTVTTCNGNPCGAHGTCLQAVLPTNALAIYCRCEAQWTGQYCDVSLAGNCPTNVCQNGGTCTTAAGGGFICSCPQGYTGSVCDTVLLSTTATPLTTMTTVTTAGVTTMTVTPATTTSGRCTSTSCANGGTCFNNGNNFICLCTTQYTGPTCNLQQSMTTGVPTTAANANACASSPCQNGGSCYRYGNSFVCVCTSPYAGATCDVPKTTIAPSLTTTKTGLTCADSPCQNGGLCYNTGNTYFCYCGTGSTYTGKNCETSVIASDPTCSLDCSPGYCVRTGGVDTYACMCNGVLTPTSCSSK